MRSLEQVEGWGAANACAAVVVHGELVASHGDAAHVYRWASVTQLVTALTTLVASEEGSIDLDAPAGPPGSTVRHLLAHASGLPFEGDVPIAAPGQRRIYSNTGFVQLAEALETATQIAFEHYLHAAVLDPLEMTSCELRGHAGAGLHGSLSDVIALARELLRPTLVAPETLAEATSVQFPGLVGVLPGIGRHEPADWGLGFELKDAKAPHWIGARNSPRTVGHFGGAGTVLWVDPERSVALACLTDREFDDWALDAWPRLSDAVLEELEQ